MKKIPFTQGKFATVNSIDYSFLMQWKWCFNNGYAIRNSHKSDGLDKQKLIYMHREILIRKLGHSDFEETDHKNQNKLDNWRGNLRPASCSENQRNCKTQQGTSKFRACLGINVERSGEPVYNLKAKQNTLVFSLTK